MCCLSFSKLYSVSLELQYQKYNYYMKVFVKNVGKMLNQCFVSFLKAMIIFVCFVLSSLIVALQNIWKNKFQQFQLLHDITLVEKTILSIIKTGLYIWLSWMCRYVMKTVNSNIVVGAILTDMSTPFKT